MASGWNDKRPMSPHLQIWRWHPTMLSSILHRASGIILFVAILKICIFLAVLSGGPKTFTDWSGLVYSPLGAFSFFAVTGLISFHWLNGIKYLIWDSGKLMNPKTANVISVAIIALATIIAIVLTACLVKSTGGA